ncbi:EAL domain-containing protein [Mesorhizobium sp. AR10]|nr:EAL domain-containing protein [Mesorhizobium sp. AR10]
MEEHESLELDEIILALLCIGLSGFIFAARRLTDLRSEVRRRRTAEDDASWIARHDPLTRLPNRRYLADFTASAVAGEVQVVFALDLDGFKRANDLLGHAAGDEVLTIVADRLRKQFPTSMIARQGGDEFLILASQASVPFPLVAAQETIAFISEPIQIGGTDVEIGVSVGIAIAEPGKNAADLVDQADVALYVAKSAGRNTAKVFDAAMMEFASERAKMGQALRHAIRNGDIVPYFQPLVNLASGRLIGFEALARWNRGNGISTPPDVFISLAEQAGLITELSDSLLRQACRVAATWPNDLRLAFNVSPMQMGDKLLGLRIVRILDAEGLPPNRLEIEITESAVVRELAAATQIISDLRSAGIQVALDDFGTGFSSLSQLGNFSFDRIKVDRSFVAECERDPKRLKIIKAILNLGKGLGIHTTAEGIETAAQFDLMKGMGCENGQGYLFSPAIPASELVQFIERESVRLRA